MPDSFYNALAIFLPLALVAFAVRRAMRPNVRKKVKKEIENRLFAESPTFVAEDINLYKDPGGFYAFRVEGLVANVTDGSVEVRIVQGTHSGKAFLTWEYRKPQSVDLKAQFTGLYPKP